MAYRVLVVDDSSFFCRRVKDILNQDRLLEVIGIARNGEEAIKMVAELKPDVVTMDVEMPVMDGITAVKRIMKVHPLPILMFSSLTSEGAQATLDALDAGALDFLPKKFEDIARNSKESSELLQTRVRILASKRGLVARRHGVKPNTPLSSPGRPGNTHVFMRSSSVAVAPATAQTNLEPAFTNIRRSSGKEYQLLAIGTSTGGPIALQNILTELPETFPHPIVLVQHMPGSFTKAFANRLNQMCNITVKEATHGERLVSGCAYLAPGGKQMLIEGLSHNARVKITEVESRDHHLYKPSVDLTFQSLSQVYAGNVLAIILTGMGADGKEGCAALKQKGAKIWAQDEQTSVVYGMPQAITKANISERNLPLFEIPKSIMLEMRVK
ncbi:chemotaxis response regulator protein-glutamate methylesterase [Aliiglaciecola sp. 3_MG-2023]|uniref:protein-glutamate methylesterase/protein-glutamine glutaminase n=1 Tax=Aliiglaciecola sp. 3_MG-2023 TaxID=3062644 RepID=UPI0026E3BE99|nr:chemotaxis response regulator protein-glutamate methylesterase [Aliiglaciecola sp. 3_MG-2023]MDO6693929.1 chemotaxis response regulator protein-glutamate methylesterase [Aliiglaciecola sp. 3_MG-2023]